MGNIIRKILEFIRTTDIYVLVYSPILISMILFVGLPFLGERIFASNVPEKYVSAAGACCILISSLSGLVQIIRKESPGVFGISFRGILPVLMGILWITITWSLGFGLLYTILINN